MITYLEWVAAIGGTAWLITALIGLLAVIFWD